MIIKGSDAIVRCLELEHTDIVFGYPGSAILPLYDSLTKSEIKNVLVRHEANACHSASGYARISGRPAVCIATSGPGSTNLITAIATAYMDSVPVIIITGQVGTDQIGSDVFQEADITGSAEPFVKHSYLIKNVNDIPKILKEAFYICASGRPGPVLIDIPVDILNSSLDFSYPQNVNIRSYKPTIKGNKLQIKRIISALSSSHKPLICVGGGTILAGAQNEINTLALTFDIPVVSTMMGLSCFSDTNPLYFGMIGVYGTECANNALCECDLLMVIGARFGDRAVNSPNYIKNGTIIIHIDIDPAEIGKNITADIPVVGNAKTIITQILELSSHLSHSDWIDSLNLYRNNNELPLINNRFVSPQAYIKKLSKAMPDNTTVICDVGQNLLWCANNWFFDKGRFLTSGGMGTMGYSIPAAIGAKLADMNKEVVVITGDGAFLMQMMELATINQEKIAVKIILVNNSCLGLIKQIQKENYNANYTSVALDGSPDYMKLCEAFGIKSMRVHDEPSALKSFQFVKESKQSCLIEVIINPDDTIEEA